MQYLILFKPLYKAGINGKICKRLVFKPKNKVGVGGQLFSMGRALFTDSSVSADEGREGGGRSTKCERGT